jgi:hypothetical protein
MTEGTISNVNGLTDVILITGAGLDKPLVYVKLESENLGGTMNGHKIDAKVDTNDYDDSINEHSWADDGGFVPDDEDDEDELEEDEYWDAFECDDPACSCRGL